MMSQTLKIGIVGAGVFGGFHAQKLSQMRDIVLGGILDPDLARAQDLAQKHQSQAFSAHNWNGFIAELEAIIIATPAQFHFEWAQKALAAGLHVYCEKPLAFKASEAFALAKLAEDNGLILSVGHQERAVFEAMGLFSVPESPISLEAVRRRNPKPAQS